MPVLPSWLLEPLRDQFPLLPRARPMTLPTRRAATATGSRTGSSACCCGTSLSTGAVSREALTRIRQEIRSWRIHRHSDMTFAEIIAYVNTRVAGGPPITGGSTSPRCRHGLSASRADAIWDVAALHATAGFSDFKSTETALGSSGIVGDVTGLGLDQLDQATVKAIALDHIPAFQPGSGRSSRPR